MEELEVFSFCFPNDVNVFMRLMKPPHGPTVNGFVFNIKPSNLSLMRTLGITIVVIVFITV